MTTDRSRPSIFWLIACFATPLLGFATRYRFHNPEKFPQSGPFVIAPNHYSEIDPVIVGFAVWRLGRKPRFLAKASLFRVPVVGALLRAMGQIPVERSVSAAHTSIRAAETLVKTGGLVIVYPEGSLTRDPDLWPMRGKTGAARIALEADIPVIPIAHWGTQALMPRYGKKISVFPRKTIDIIVGDPVDLEKYRGKASDRSALAAATSEIMSAITELVAKLRGEAPPTERWNPATHGQKETGRLDS